MNLYSAWCNFSTGTNLYGAAMMGKLPISDYKMLSEEEVNEFDVLITCKFQKKLKEIVTLSSIFCLIIGWLIFIILQMRMVIEDSSFK